MQQGLLLIASDARPSLSSFIAACAVQSWEHRPGAMHVPACVLMAARLDQNLHLSLLLDYCHHREPKDLKDTKTATLRTLFFDILPRGSQSQGAGSSPRENSADGRQQEPCRDHSLSHLCSATVHWVFFSVCLKYHCTRDLFLSAFYTIVFFALKTLPDILNKIPNVPAPNAVSSTDQSDQLSHELW